MTWASTSLRISVIARCAATPSTWDRENDVMDSTSVAAPTASASRGSSSQCCFETTSSMKYFVEVGSTSPARRLTTINANPTASRLRCVQMSARASSSAPAVTFFFGGDPGGTFAPGAGRDPRLRSALPSPLIFKSPPSVRKVCARVTNYPSRAKYSFRRVPMTSWKTLIVCTAWLAVPQAVYGQSPDLKAAAAEIVKADADFARAVADKDRQTFLSFVAETTTFNGGSASELRGRDAVMKEWEEFFAPEGPRLTWQPIKGEVILSGDVGYTTGRSVLRVKAKDGTESERLGVYLTVWRKQPDGRWRVVFDTGSTLPQGAR